MLKQALRRPFRALWSLDIPHNIVRKSSFRVPILPILQSDKAYIRVRNGPFQPPI